MDAPVSVLELQNDFSVKQYSVPLRFPRVGDCRLFIVTNQNTQLHLLNNGNPRRAEVGSAIQEKSIFQHGVSTKVFAIMDATGTEWEVRVLLSPSEISRLSSNFNLTGFVSGCLTLEEYQNHLSSLGHCDDLDYDHNVEELCRAAAKFLSYSEDNIVNDYCKELSRTLIKNFGESFIGQQKLEDMVNGALVTLVAAELATSAGGTRSFDYRFEKEKTPQDQSEQIQKMIHVFDVMAELLTVSHQGKRVQIIFRNPCPDNWASGGKKLDKSGETFVFGLSHKVVSISEEKSKIQFLQSLQETYDLVPVFHLPAFVEELLMTSAWRNKIKLFLKESDQRKQIIREMSSLALRFICSKTCHQETFSKDFQCQMLEKWSSVEAFLVGDEVMCSFGILVAILVAVTVRSNVDRCPPNGEEEDSEEPAAELVDHFASAAPETNVSAGSSSTSLDDSLGSYEEIVTNTSDEYGGAQTNLCSSPGDWVKEELKSGEVGVDCAESKIDSTNDRETTNLGSISGPPKSGELLAEPPSVTTLDTADQETDNDSDDNFDKYPGVRDPAHESSPNSPEAERGSHDQGSNDSPGLDDSSDGADRVAQPPSIGAQDNVCDSSPTSPEVEEGCHSQGSADDPNLDDSSDGAYRVAQPPSVAAQYNACESSPSNLEAEGGCHVLGSGDGPSLDDSKYDRAYRVAETPSVGAQDNSYESSPTIPEAKEGHHSQGSAGGPNLDDSSDDGASSVAQPPSITARDNVYESSPTVSEGSHSQGSGDSPSLDDYKDDSEYRVEQPPRVGSRDNALESQDSSSRRRMFYTRFIGLVCLLVFAMLTHVLPQSVSPVFVAIILGLLVVTWRVSQQP